MMDGWDDRAELHESLGGGGARANRQQRQRMRRPRGAQQARARLWQLAVQLDDDRGTRENFPAAAPTSADASSTSQAPPAVLSSAEAELYRAQGFLVVRNLLPQADIDTICQHADAFAAEFPAYQARNSEQRAQIEAAHEAAHAENSLSSKVNVPTNATALTTGETLSPRHARLGDRFYPLPLQHATAAQKAERASLWEQDQDPWVVGDQRPISQLNYMADNDPVMRKMAAHPRIVSVLQALLSPDCKLWFDHVWSKPPLSHATESDTPSPGSNRYHQDGFFQFSRPSTTCWICLDHVGVTETNGAFHYIPIGAAGGYGEFGFDIMGRGNGEGLSVEHLAEEQVPQ